MCMIHVQDITIRVSLPLNVDDLIEQHEQKHGKLRKFSPSVDKDDPAYSWVSTPQG